MTRWLRDLNQDLILVYEWNKYLYRRVLLTGMVSGLFVAALLGLIGLILAWFINHV